MRSAGSAVAAADPSPRTARPGLESQGILAPYCACGGSIESVSVRAPEALTQTNDSRGWGDLFKDTPLEFPAPCKELQTLGILPCYSFGGSGGEMSAPASTYYFPPEG